MGCLAPLGSYKLFRFGNGGPLLNAVLQPTVQHSKCSPTCFAICLELIFIDPIKPRVCLFPFSPVFLLAFPLLRTRWRLSAVVERAAWASQFCMSWLRSRCAEQQRGNEATGRKRKAAGVCAGRAGRQRAELTGSLAPHGVFVTWHVMSETA